MSHAFMIVAVDGTIEERDKIREAVAHEMEPFDENNEWFRNGSRWDYWQIGGRYSGRIGGHDIVRRGNVNPHGIRQSQKTRYKSLYRQARAENKPADTIEFIYGLEPDEPLESYLDRMVVGLHAWGFLKDRTWHEKRRMGWFGVSYATECEIESGERPNICVYRHDDTDAEIISWEVDPEDEEAERAWSEKYWDRFIGELPPETWLVAVDYHV